MLTLRPAVIGSTCLRLLQAAAAVAVSALLLSGQAFADPAASGYTITDLGSFYPTGINNSGQVTGTQATGNVSQAVIWSQGTVTPLPFLPGGQSSSASAIANLPTNSSSAAFGEVVGQAADSAGHEVGTYWLNGGAAAARGGRSAFGVNDAGDIAGQVFRNDFAGNLFIYAVVWKASGPLIRPLGDGTDGRISAAKAINNNGDIVGYFNPGTGSSSYGFLQTFAGRSYDIRLSNDNRAIARAINDNQQVVGESSGPGTIRGFVFTPNPQTITALPPLTVGVNTSAYGVNKTGEIVGYSQRSDAFTGNILVSHATRWVQVDASTLVPVDLNELLPAASGWSNLSIATAINDTGQIAGSGTHNGQTEAFLLSPPLLGVDVSTGTDGFSNSAAIAKYRSLNTSDGKKFVIANAWNAYYEEYDPHLNLSAASAAGITNLAAYCELNFNNHSSDTPGVPFGANQTGTLQVAQAFDALEQSPISFMAIAVEPNGNGPYLSQDDAVQRIADAVQAVRSQGVPAIIYTRDGASQHWHTITGNSKEVQGVPLWDVDLNNPQAPRLDNFVPYGPWTSRIGRQYSLAASLEGIGVDLNIFDPSAFNLPRPTGAPYLSLTPIAPVTSLAGSTASVYLKIVNAGTDDALATRINSAYMLGSARLTNALPIKFNTLAPGGFGYQTLTFANAQPGPNYVRIDYSCGGFVHSVTWRINLVQSRP